MSTQDQQSVVLVSNNVTFDPHFLEQILLTLADAFDIRVVWNKDTAVLTGVLAVAGGVIGGYSGGRLGAALGAGIGGVTGFGVSTVVSLREIWSQVKRKLIEVLYILFNRLRQVDPEDMVLAFSILMKCKSSRTELVSTIINFIAMKLGQEVLSSITAG